MVWLQTHGSMRFFLILDRYRLTFSLFKMECHITPALILQVWTIYFVYARNYRSVDAKQIAVIIVIHYSFLLRGQTSYGVFYSVKTKNVTFPTDSRPRRRYHGVQRSLVRAREVEPTPRFTGCERWKCIECFLFYYYYFLSFYTLPREYSNARVQRWDAFA